jgi:phosphopantetheine adenylyltransferase
MVQKKVNKEMIQSVLMRINEVKEFVQTIKPDI